MVRWHPVTRPPPAPTGPGGGFVAYPVFFFFKVSADHRDLHVGLHSFPTRRSSDLRAVRPQHGWWQPEHQHVGRCVGVPDRDRHQRSEEHTSELQSQSHISYAVFCLKKKKKQKKKQKKTKKTKKKKKKK